MKKALIIYPLLLILLAFSVFSAGTCSLDKENYIPGNNGRFSCGCTLPIEENAAGFMVWRNASGVIKNTSISSGLCRTSVFSDDFMFSEGDNFTGNVTFETASAQWAQGDDDVFDNFSVSGASVTDCIIQNAETRSEFDVGTRVAGKLEVVDGITLSPLIHANCVIDILDSTRNPIVVEPYKAGHSAVESTSEGSIFFLHELNERIWSTNTEYILGVRCYCTPSGDDEQCYLEINGTSPGFKSCSAEFNFTTSSADFRENNQNNKDGSAGIAITIFIIIIALLIFFLPAIFGDLSRNQYTNIILKRACYVVGIYLMMLNSAMIATIAGNAELPLTNELFRYMWLLGLAGYVAMFWMCWQALVDVLELWKFNKTNKRTGDGD